MSEESVKNVVLVHGGFVDGSGWQGVYDLLTEEGYSVKIVQNPTVSLEDDVAVTRRAIADCDGPVVLSATPTEAPSSPKPAPTRKSPPSSTSQGSYPTRANLSARSSPIRRPARPSHRSCRPGTGSSSWTAESLPPHSRRTCRPGRRPSWLTHRSPGASAHSKGQSPHLPGEGCPAGT
jgi:hypothetical protein